MQVENNDKYTVIKLKLTTDFNSFYEQFNSKVNTLKELNLIIDFSDFNIHITDLLKLKKFALTQIESGISFVVISKEIDLDNLPDELIVVPTFQEAIDMIEMDEMTRSLDF